MSKRATTKTSTASVKTAGENVNVVHMSDDVKRLMVDVLMNQQIYFQGKLARVQEALETLKPYTYI